MNANADIRMPPHSNDAEQSVLGGLMLDQRAFEKIADKLVEDDFYRKDHRLIYRAIGELSNKNQPYDAVTLGEWFESNGLAELVGGSNYVTKLANSTASAANIVAYADIVREKSVLRQVIDAASTLVEDGFRSDGRGAQDIIDGAIARLMSLQRAETKAEFTSKQAIKLAFDNLAAVHLNGGALNTIPSGLVDLDRIIGGFHRGDLVIVGARAAMGKTALLTNIALHAAETDHAIGFISGEQPVEQIATRMMALSANVSATKFRTGKIEESEWPRVTDATTKLIKSRMHFLDRSAPSIAEVQRVARRWRKEHGIEALYVDYLQRLEAPGDRRWESVGAVVRGLKNLARDLDIPVIVLAQVSRQVEVNGKGREPRLGDLADSSEIEKEADQVLMLFREGYYEKKAPQGVARVIIEKNRHGPTGFVDLAWDAEIMRFGNLVRGYAA